MVNTFLTPSVIAARALATLYETTVMLPLVYRDVTSDFSPRKVGDTVNVRKPATFTANEFVRASGITIQTATEGSIPVVLNKIADVSFVVTVEELSLRIEDFATQLLNPAMEAISQKIDRDLIALNADITQECGSADYTTGTDDYWQHPENLIEAGRLLDIANVPSSERRAVIGPTTKAKWLGTPLLLHVDHSDSTAALRQASLGDNIAGFGTFWSQNIAQPAGSPATGQPTTEVGLAFHRTAFAFASAPLEIPPSSNAIVVNYRGLNLRVVSDYDINKKQTVVSVDTLYGVKTLEAVRAVKLKGINAP